MGLRGIALLISVFVIVVVQCIEPFGLGIIHSAKASAPSGAILVAVDHKPPEIDSPAFGPKVRNALLHKLTESERNPGNFGIVFTKDMVARNKSSVTNRIGSFGSLQWPQGPCFDFLQFNVAFDDLGVATTDISNNVSQLNIWVPPRKTQDFANNELWRVARNKFGAGKPELIEIHNPQPRSRNEQEASENHKAQIVVSYSSFDYLLAFLGGCIIGLVTIFGGGALAWRMWGV